MPILNRFAGPSGKNNLITALQAQSIIQGNTYIASHICDRVTLIEHPVGSTIIIQDSADNDLYFILSGRVAIRVNNRDIAFRTAGTHIGEMAMIDPSARRSASVIATESTLVARISAQDFCSIADKYPVIWKCIAIELGNRLRQRNQYVKPPNLIPALFIGSSKESVPILNLLLDQLGKSKNMILIPWTADIFWPSSATLEDLETRLPSIDFAVLIFGPDDKITSRKVTSLGPRDNVLLECGMFFGAIGRKRTYFLKPKETEIKLPSDLFGLKPIHYEYDGSSEKVDVSNACKEIMRCVKRYGVK